MIPFLGILIDQGFLFDAGDDHSVSVTYSVPDLIGKVESVTFGNKSTCFYVLKVKLDPDQESTSQLCVVRGTFPGVNFNSGVKAKFHGEWVEHPSYGHQFSASSCEVFADKGRSGIVSYLQTNVPSIGPITAFKLYDALGDDLINALENEPDKIRALSFLTRPQIEAIINEWATSKEVRTVSIFLHDLGLSAGQIRTVYTKFGNRTREFLDKDPYCLYQCPGVGFVSADNAARRLGVGVDDPRRVRAMILFTMNELAQSEGHMFCTSEQIASHVKKLFYKHGLDAFSHGEYISDSHYYSTLSDLKIQGSIVSKDGCLYLDQNWDHEDTAAACVAEIVKQEPRDFGDLTEALIEFEQMRGVSLSDEQKQAFMSLGKSRFCCVSGFPGTGKTLLVSAFVYLFERAKLEYTLLSPTGIAAKRLSQVTGKPASTIHRALAYQKDGSWKFNSSNLFYTDAVVLDESSMCDGATFFHLISTLPATTIVICIGDSAQLPSVGAGYVLNNLMNCPDVPHVSLTRIYRQQKQSDIISVAHAILKNEHVDTSFNKDSQFIFLNYSKDHVMGEISKIASSLKTSGANFQVIAPMYDGDLGVNNLNKSLREVLNSDYNMGKATKIKSGVVDFYEGDRIMVVKNDYDRMIYNGDMGKIVRISPKSDEVEVKIFDWFDQESVIPQYIDKIFTYKIDEVRQNLRVAYACTAHKYQGKEIDYVVMPMTMQYGIMLYKNLIYTAITRAKKKVFLFGDPAAFTYAVMNDRETVRNSNLAHLIGKYSSEVLDELASSEIETFEPS